MPIICIERVIVAVTALEASCDRWTKAGFAIAAKRIDADGLRIARMYAGAVEMDLVAMGQPPESFRDVIERGGGIIGWTWGVDEAAKIADTATSPPTLPLGDTQTVTLTNFLPGVWTGIVTVAKDLVERRANLEQLCGVNENSVDFLEHIVVMTPSLEGAIAAHEKIGLPCKRIREAGRGMRQAFFKLEQTVLEVVGPNPATPQVWGLAFMCKDIRRAIDLARANGLQATEPKAAAQGGKIARIVDPLDGVAIAYMEAAS